MNAVHLNKYNTMKVTDIVNEAARAAVAPVSSGTDVSGLIKKVILRDKIGPYTVKNPIMAAAGRYIQIIKWLGFYEFAETWWINRTAISTLVAEKQITPEDGEAAKRIEAEKLVVEIIATNMFPKIIMWILRMRYIKLIPQILGGIATILTAGTMGPAEIALILATEVAALQLQKFLNTPEGKTMVAYCVMYAIDPTFTMLYNLGPGKFLGEIKNLSDAAKPVVAAATIPAGQGAKASAADPGAKADQDATSQGYSGMSPADIMKTNPQFDKAKGPNDTAISAIKMPRL